MTKKEYKSLLKFIEENHTCRPMVNNTLDSDHIELRLCPTYEKLKEDQANDKPSDYFLIQIKIKRNDL